MSLLRYAVRDLFGCKEGDVVEENGRRIPVLLWPFYAIWRLVALILEITGRIIGVILGLVLLIVGLLVSLTVVGAVVGVPLIILGMLLILRGLF
ncbi:MAG: hypothetical protein PVH50_08735 [Anaerolineae bacterium]|jgi:hypothetical protein